MLEYLIKRTDDEQEWFNLPSVLWATYLCPKTIASQPVDADADYSIEVEGKRIEFNYEVFAMHVTVAGEMPETQARQILAEILNNIEQVTGQRGQIVELQ